MNECSAVGDMMIADLGLGLFFFVRLFLGPTFCSHMITLTMCGTIFRPTSLHTLTSTTTSRRVGIGTIDTFGLPTSCEEDIQLQEAFSVKMTIRTKQHMFPTLHLGEQGGVIMIGSCLTILLPHFRQH